MPVILRDGGNGVLRLATALSGHRHLMITIQSPKSGKLEMGVWGRYQGEPTYCLLGGPHLPDEFLSDIERAIVRGGLEEVLACIKDESPGDGFEKRLASAVSAILDAAARGDVAEDAPAA